ncbi:MAG: hypothetical protein L6Q37_07535, partial [Bdellovibrionaceae bacterium]|nr:hypothetical protein [Pseudobdellovibrionaceae bacterium]
MLSLNVHFFFILFYFLGTLYAEPNLVILQNFESLKKIQIGKSCRDNTSCNYWNNLLAEENQYSRFAGIIPSSVKKCKN